MEERRRASPGEFRRSAVMHGHALLVGEGVMGVVAEELEVLAGRLQAVLEAVDRRGGDVVVIVGEMPCSGTLTSAGLTASAGGMP